MFRFSGGLRLSTKVFVQLKAVSKVIYPVPMKIAAAETRIAPIDMAVPSSSNW